jgi:hypothetical protein
VVDGSSWSCAHGVERWRADCGCRGGRHPGWTQHWRAPLREALDWLRDAVDPLYEARASALVKDPWAARDAYVQVLLDRSPASVDAFFDRHGLRPLDGPDRVQALRCLELQRHRLLMYTSCGWFFDEISGIETVQVLRHAARVLQLAQALGAAADLETEFVRRLAAASSNVPELRDGAGVWRRHVTPSVSDLARVAAHYAIAGPSEGYGDPADVYAFRVERLEWARVAAGRSSLAIGRVRVTARPTTESVESDVAVLHAADGEVHCRVRPAAAALAATRQGLFRDFAGAGDAGAPAALARHFGGRAYGIAEVFPDEQRRLLAERARRAMEAGDGRSGRGLTSRGVEEELTALAAGAPVVPAVNRIRALVAEARSLGIPGLRPEWVAQTIEAALDRHLEALRAGATVRAVDDALALLTLGTVLEAPPELWAARNAAAHLWREGSEADRDALGPLMAALGFAPAAFASPREKG